MQEIDLHLDHHDFFCPVTGKQILSEDDSNSSPATIFIYVDDFDNFAEIRQDFQRLYEEKCNIEFNVGQEKDGLPSLKRFMKHFDDIPNLVVFKITNSGIACGPLSSTVHICIDMNYSS